MRIIIEDPPADFADKLLALIAEHSDALSVSTDTEWTEERAATLLRNLPSRAARVIRAAVDGGGYVAAEELREDGKALRGHTGPITQAIKRGARLGWWPEGMANPIEAEYNPEIAGYQRTVGFRLPDDLLPVFQTATARVDDMAFGTTHLSALTKAVKSERGTWDMERAVEALGAAGFDVSAKRARELLRRIADTGLLIKADPDRAIYTTAEQ